VSILALLLFAPSVAVAQHKAAQKKEVQTSCVELVGDSADAFAVALGPMCDLREAVRRFPQIDAATRRAFSEQQQLRSIFAENERRFAEGRIKVRNVGRGCVPSVAAPPSATNEELEVCPNGPVNYFGVASAGARHAVIWVPKARVASSYERYETLGRTACEALGGVAAAAPVSGGAPDPVREALHRCADLVPDAVSRAPPPAVAASRDESAERVKALTQELGAARAEIERLRAREPPVAAQVGRAPPSPPNRGLVWTVVALGVLVLVAVARELTRRRAGAPASQPGRVTIDRATLERAVGAIRDAYVERIEREASDAARWRAASERLERELRAARLEESTRGSAPAARRARARDARGRASARESRASLSSCAQRAPPEAVSW
jgi:hypothetical protein